MYYDQWRIQDFSDGDANPRDAGANLLFGQILLKTAWKLKKLDREEDVPDASHRSAHVIVMYSALIDRYRIR